jgi:phosphohistidine phosphatase
MQIFVLRHGQAELQKTTDAARNLTQQGRDDVASNVAQHFSLLKNVSEIWVSPLVRAQQTAAIAHEIFLQHGINLNVRTLDVLVPEASPSMLIDTLQKSSGAAPLLVSHLPLLGDFLVLLCGAPSGVHALDTSSLACVTCEPVAAGLGELQWLHHAHA